jgi:environmental stress-induced protein Ves
MSALRLIPASAPRTQPWANGAGTTTVIASGPDEALWQWRLSIAEIAQDCTFSALIPIPGDGSFRWMRRFGCISRISAIWP